MARWHTMAALLALLGGMRHSRHKSARALRFVHRHPRAHRKILRQLRHDQQEHEARQDEQFFRGAQKLAATPADKPRRPDPLPWTRRGKRLAKRQKARTIHPVPAQRDH